MLRVPLILAALFALGGCKAYQRPILNVADVEVGDRSDAGIVLKVALDAENRNEFELPLREIHYQVRLEGGQTFSGLRSAEASLRRFGTQRITFPAVIPLIPDTPPPTGNVRVEVSGSLDYMAPGDVAQILYDTGFYKPTQSFSGAAAVSLDSKAQSMATDRPR
jgi:hypothetical protein